MSSSEDDSASEGEAGRLRDAVVSAADLKTAARAISESTKPSPSTSWKEHWYNGGRGL